MNSTQPDDSLPTLPPQGPPSSSSGIVRPTGAQTRTMGPYQLARELARGGMGVVYVARRPGLDREVALKVLLTDDGPSRARFHAEARISARLRHPNIVGVHDVGEHEGRPYLVMDLIQGESLKDKLTREGPLPGHEAAALGLKLARALSYAHQHAVLHRDLKPHNVLIDGDGQPWITDFGLAKAVDDEGVQRLTKTGQVMGTPNYMPPEQAAGELDQVDRRSDVYGLGAVLYEVLTGAPPFEGSSVLNVINAVLTRPAPPARRARPEVPLDLETICARCLEKAPDQRYPSASALAQDLERFLDDRPISARRVGWSERLARHLRRHRLAWVLGGVGGLLLVAALAVERARTEAAMVGAAGEEAAEVHAAFAAGWPDARAQARQASSESERAAALAPWLARGLEVYSVAQRWYALHPEDPEARALAVEAARGLAEVAACDGQWQLATQVCARALSIDDSPTVQAWTAGIEQERAQERQARIEDLDGVLAASDVPFADRAFALVRHAGSDAVEHLGKRLDAMTLELGGSAWETLDPGEGKPEIRASLRTWLGGAAEGRVDWEPTLESLRGLPMTKLRDAWWLQRGQGTEAIGNVDLLIRLGRLTSRRHGPELLETARLVCEALGRMGHAEQSRDALGRYLQVQFEPTEATYPALALLRLGDARGRAWVERALDRFVHHPGFARSCERVYVRAYGLEAWLAVQGAVDPRPEWERRARRALARHRPEEALVALGGAGEAAGRTARILRARAQLQQHDWRGLEALDALVREDPTDAVARTARADGRLRAGLLEGAEEDLVELLEQVGDEPEVSLLFAEVLLEQPDGAGQALERVRGVLEERPDWARAHAALARAQLGLGDPWRAQDAADRAVEFDPDEPRGHCARAAVALALEDPLAARRALQAATALPACPPSGWVTLAEVCALRLNDPARARVALESAAERMRDDGALDHLRGRLLMMLNRPTEALAALERAAQRTPREAEVVLDRGMARSLTGDSERGLADVRRAVELDPRLSRARHNLAVLLTQRRQHEAALRELNVLLEQEPGHLNGLSTRARVRAELGDVEGAIEDATATIGIKPEWGEAWLTLALAHQASGDAEAALRTFDHALGLEPGLAAAHFRKGLLLGSLDRNAEAEAALTRALEGGYDAKDVLFYRAAARAGCDDYAGCAEDSERYLALDDDTPRADRVRRMLRAARGRLEGR